MEMFWLIEGFFDNENLILRFMIRNAYNQGEELDGVKIQIH